MPVSAPAPRPASVQPVAGSAPLAERVELSGARRPDRTRSVSSSGLRLAVYEWGDPKAPPLLLAHGGFDFAGTFDAFAPLLADAGWRVVSWDHRGHGDSEHAALYGWGADMRDALVVLDSVDRAAMPVVGHSKGGGVLTQLAMACPHRVSRLVNIDGLPSRHARPDVPEHDRTKLLAAEVTSWLDHRARAASLERKPGSLDDLARRRGRMNPRLSHAWLRYLVTIGARRDADGWRWKIDPTLRFGGFGPWRPEWMLDWLPGLPARMLAILGLIPEQMGWGTTPESLAGHLPRRARLEAIADSGHFVHIEKPHEVAALVLDFLRER